MVNSAIKFRIVGSDEVIDNHEAVALVDGIEHCSDVYL